MKCCLLFIFGCLAFSTSLHAQELLNDPVPENPLVGINFSISDTSNNHIFENHPNIESIYVWFDNNEPALVHIQDAPRSVSFYDLNFKGDVLDLAKKYGMIKFTVPKVSLRKLYGKQHERVPTYWRLSALIFQDSIVYTPVYQVGIEPEIPIYGYGVRFSGDYVDLAKQVADEIRERKPGVVRDSTIVLQGIVEKVGENPLKDLKLIVGKQSDFSDIAMKVLGSDQNKWAAAVYKSGVYRASKVKFYLQLHNDGSVFIQVPKYMDPQLLH